MALTQRAGESTEELAFQAFLTPHSALPPAPTEPAQVFHIDSAHRYQAESSQVQSSRLWAEN